MTIMNQEIIAKQTHASFLPGIICLTLLLSLPLLGCVPAIVSLSDTHVTLKRDPSLYKQEESDQAAYKYCGSIGKKSEFITTTQATVFSHSYDHYKCLNPEKPQ